MVYQCPTCRSSGRSQAVDLHKIGNDQIAGLETCGGVDCQRRIVGDGRGCCGASLRDRRKCDTADKKQNDPDRDNPFHEPTLFTSESRHRSGLAPRRNPLGRCGRAPSESLFKPGSCSNECCGRCNLDWPVLGHNSSYSLLLPLPATHVS